MLPASERLRSNRDFRLIYARGRSEVHRLAVLYVWRRSGESAPQIPGRRIGFVVSKKQGDAVVRNRIKRRLREAVRRRLNDLCDGPLDLIFVGRSGARTATWKEIETAIEELLRRAGLLQKGGEPL